RGVEATAQRTLQETARIAFTDRRGLWQADRRLKPFDQWTADEAALLEGFEVVVRNVAGGDGDQDIIPKVHLAKKLPALELLMRHFGLLKDRVEVEATVKHSLEALIPQANALENSNG